jgi:hypothetical protein
MQYAPGTPDIPQRLADVRFTPKSGHHRRTVAKKDLARERRQRACDRRCVIG